MTDWNLAIQIFITGILGVMVVMFLLQVSIQLTSVVIKYLEKTGEKVKSES
jgi:hypothetical protein